MSTISVSIPTDGDGFVSQECPHCSRRFKVRFEQGTGKTLGHCPYCAYAGKDCWWTTEQADYLTEVMSKRVVEPMLDKFARDLRSLNSRPSLIKFDAKITNRTTPRAPTESDSPMPTVTFSCCNETIKHDGTTNPLHCVICGRKSPAKDRQWDSFQARSDTNCSP